MHRQILPSGMTLLLAPRPDSDVATCQLWVRVGSGYELCEESGISHLIEHLVFRSTHKYQNNQLTDVVEHLGGQLNAFTSLDATAYHLTLPSKSLDEGMEVLAELVLRADLKERDLHTEQRIISEEIKEEEESAEMMLERLLFALAYPDSSYGRPIIGHRPTVENTSLATVQSFYQRVYHPANMVLVVAGAFEKKRVLEQATTLFVSQATQNNRQPAYPLGQNVTTGVQLEILHRGEQQQTLELAIPIPHLAHQHTVHLDLIASILGGGDFSRLHRRLYEEEQSVYAIDSYCFSPKRSGIFVVRASLVNGDYAGVLQSIFTEIAKLTTESITKDELALAKQVIERDILMERQTVDGIAHSLAFHEIAAEDHQWEELYLHSLSTLTIDDVQKVPSLHLGLDNLAVALLTPADSAPPLQTTDIEGLAEDASKTTGIKSRKRDKAKQPASTTKMDSLQSEQQLITVQQQNSCFASIYLAVKGGVLAEQSDQLGITSLLLTMLDRGRGKEIAKALAAIGADFDTLVGRSASSITMSLPDKNLKKGVQLFFDILQAPNIEESIFLREKQVIQQELLEEQDLYEVSSYNNFKRQLYGTHAYGRNSLGDENTLESLSPPMVEDFHARRFLAAPWSLAIVSSADQDTCRKMVEEVFQPTQQSTDTKHFETAKPHTQPKELEQIINGAKSHIHLGFVTPPIDQGLWPAVEALNGVLTSFGGGTLYRQLREELGLAYTVQCYTYHGTHGGHLIIYVNTDPPHTKKVVDLTKRHLEELSDTPQLEEELVRGRNYLVGAHKIGLQRTSAKASTLANNHLLGLEVALDDYEKELNKVTVQDLKQLLDTYLSPKRQVLLVSTPR